MVETTSERAVAIAFVCVFSVCILTSVLVPAAAIQSYKSPTSQVGQKLRFADATPLAINRGQPENKQLTEVTPSGPTPLDINRGQQQIRNLTEVTPATSSSSNLKNPSTPSDNNAGTPSDNNAASSSNPLTALTESSSGSIFGINTIVIVGLIAVVALLLVVIAVLALGRRQK